MNGRFLVGFQWGFFPLLLVGSVGAAMSFIRAGVSLELVAMLIPAVVLLVVAVSERILPFNKDWNKRRGDLSADVSSFILVAGVLESLLKAVSPAMVAFVALYLGLNDLGLDLFPNDWPLLAQLVVFTLSADLAKYWFHRWGHETRAGWKLHSIHHAVKRVYWFNGFRIHPLYHAVNYFTAIFPLLVMGANAEVVVLYTVVLSVAAAIQHANIDLKFGFLNYIFNTNEVHRWHHSKDISEGNANYGAVVMVWDVLFGTYYNRENEQPEVIGLTFEETYPLNNYFKQLIVPFRWSNMVLGKKTRNNNNEDVQVLTPTKNEV